MALSRINRWKKLGTRFVLRIENSANKNTNLTLLFVHKKFISKQLYVFPFDIFVKGGVVNAAQLSEVAASKKYGRAILNKPTTRISATQTTSQIPKPFCKETSPFHAERGNILIYGKSYYHLPRVYNYEPESYFVTKHQFEE